MPSLAGPAGFLPNRQAPEPRRTSPREALPTVELCAHFALSNLLLSLCACTHTRTHTHTAFCLYVYLTAADNGLQRVQRKSSYVCVLGFFFFFFILKHLKRVRDLNKHGKLATASSAYGTVSFPPTGRLRQMSREGQSHDVSVLKLPPRELPDDGACLGDLPQMWGRSLRRRCYECVL